jgi:(E)-4-hydroxy-3-methylbut-2-enyl-diphosphate synthase
MDRAARSDGLLPELTARGGALYTVDRGTTVKRNPTRPVLVGSVTLGGGAPVVVQSMAATRTQDVQATIDQVRMLHRAGAGVVRIAIDSEKDAVALERVRDAVPEANLTVDLQENYRLAARVAPVVEKIRYNPGHLHHHETSKPVRDKVAGIAEAAARHGRALRVGVNCGSVDPALAARFDPADGVGPMVESALQHCAILDELGFDRYVVSLKDSDPRKVIEANRRFAAARPDVPLHLGVTEAGLPPEGVIKTRIAFEQLLAQGIGDTLRVSLTLPFDRKWEEVDVGRQILADVAAGRFRSVPEFLDRGLNIISCPSCSRVENTAFVDLAIRVKAMTAYAREHDITIAVMGCRVNGPGETDDADLGLWCAPAFVNLKRGRETLGSFPYDTVLDRLKEEVDRLIATRGAPRAARRPRPDRE